MTRDDKLRIIGQQLNWWLSHNAYQFERDGKEYNGNTHVVPPAWPTRGQLEKWVEVMFDEPPKGDQP